uniref:Uncharacterized protein n=1 Tax=Arundo donax TaxID=35708 RepID=A0A0A9CD58_ARUDO
MSDNITENPRSCRGGFYPLFKLPM